MSRLNSIAALAMLSAGGVGDFGRIASYPSRRDWSHIEHTYSEKPLTKRQKRRMRGKAKT